MNFDFTREQYMFQESVRDFLDHHWSVAQTRALLTGEGFDPYLWNRVTELGLLSMLVPEQHGGLGLNFVDLALVLEEFGRALVTGPIVETMLVTDVIAQFGTAEQASSLLPRIAAGELRIAPALSETEAGYDPGDIAVTARAIPNGWHLSGRKILVPYAHVTDKLLVAARFAEPGVPGVPGVLGLVLCDPKAAGVSLRAHETLDPASRFYEVVFDAQIDNNDVIGAKPLPVAVERLVNTSAAVAAAQMTGIAARVLEMTVAYVGQRVQFGRPIGSQQAVKHRCADMMVAVETSRTAAYYAAWSLAHNAPELTKAVSMAKAYCGDSSRFVCNEGLQLHGGIGFTWELDLHLFLRRAKVLEYMFGDASFHRERVLAAALNEIGVA